MKKILFIFLVSILYANLELQLPALIGRVVDDANILNQSTKDTLNTLLKSEEDNSSNQIVIATVKSLQGYSIEAFSVELARKWALGQKSKNNGILLLIAPNERKVRIEVGYGLEGVLTDLISHEIIANTIVPYFKRGDFDRGVLSSTKQILQVVKGEYKSDKKPSKDSSDFPIFIIFFAGFIYIIIGSKLQNKTIYRVGLATFLAGFSFPVSYEIFSPLLYPSILILIIFAIVLFFLLKGVKFKKGGNYNKYRNDFDNGFGSGFGSGGGFSGGGGGFGGGGASGGW